eukprot:TRINITY_DN4550_c0_g1_i1.p1 TRINITY_DN4550_c0_g1~~TRINITY_DN4550_c0_g1_i1.p1  ORF type:complete len:1155 (+),score=322.96 TRINITY_DN4550_c0_g1_i1:25-3465(+)
MARFCTNGLQIRRHRGLPEAQLHGEFELQNEQAGKPRAVSTLHYILVIDVSGSMAGSPIRQVNAALRAIFEHLATITTPVHLHMVDYNHTSRRKLFLDSMPAELVGSGTTSFRAAFEQVGNVLKDLQKQSCVTKLKAGDNVRVCFMTDGQDTCGGIDAAYKTLQNSLLKLKVAGVSSAVDVVAFGSSTVHKLLERVRCVGTQEGGYLFASQRDGPSVLKDMLELVFDAAEYSAACEVATIVSCARLGMADVEVTATKNVDTGVYSFDAWGKILDTKDKFAKAAAEDSQNQVVIWVTVDGKQYMNMGQPAVTEVEDESAQYYILALDYCDRQIDRLCMRAAKSKLHQRNTEKLQHLLQDVGKLMRCKAINRQLRGELLMRRAEIQERLDTLHQLVEQASRATASAKDEVVSRMSNLRFSGQLKARRQRALARRVTDNAKAVNVGAQLDALAQTVDYSKITTDMDQFYSCVLGCVGLSELMQDDASNVLGFGLSVRRPEAAVDAPTLIHVDQVGLTFLSREALLDAIKYKLNIEDQVAVHGGFEMDLASPAAATVGMAREPINAWLPLYINEDHWKRAHLLIKPTLGFFSCMDPLAFHPYQLDVPLMVLGTMASRFGKSARSERSAQVLLAFQRTCRALVESEGLLGDNHTRLRAFVSTPDMRLKHNLTTPTVLLGAWLIADAEVAAEVHAAGFFVYMKMELLRRALRTIYKARSPNAVWDMLRQMVLGVSGDERLDDDTADVLLATAMSQSSADDAPTDADITNASAGPSLMGSEFCAAPAETVLKMAMHRQVHRGLITLGKKTYGMVPGPNIQRKIATAEKAVLDWWEQGYEMARHIVSDNGSTKLLFEDLHCATQTKLDSMTKTLRDGLAVMYPTVGHLRAIEAVGRARLARVALMQDQGFCDGVPSAEAVRTLQACMQDLTFDRDADYEWLRAGMSWQAMRNMLVTCLKLQSNKDARAATVANAFPDPFAPTFTDLALNDVILRFASAETAEVERRAQSMRLPVAVNFMLSTDSLDEFLGMLTIACQDRDGTYKELMALLLSDATDAPLLGEKLSVLITGRYCGERVFARGNPDMPQNAANEQLRKKIGDDAYYSIRQAVKAVIRSHVYRASDIPNRHGSCNSNPHEPWNCPLCQANGNLQGKW